MKKHKEKNIRGSGSSNIQFSSIKTETGRNPQPDQHITAGMIQSPVAAMNTSDVFDGQVLRAYGEMEVPGARDLELKRSSGAEDGPGIRSVVEGKQGEKA